MINETTPGAVTALSPSLSPGTKPPSAKRTVKAAAKPSAPKSATSAGKQTKKAPGKKPATAVAVKKSKSGTMTKPKKDSKAKKVKMVRDSYTMPQIDYAKLAELKKLCLKSGVHVKKSELLRAGLITLGNLPTATLLKTVERLEKIKTGRPGKH